MTSTQIKIKFNKTHRVYHQGEPLVGSIIIYNNNNDGKRHDGVLLTLDGQIELTTNLKSANIMDAFSGSNKCLKLVDYTYEILSPGHLRPGRTTVP